VFNARALIGAARSKRPIEHQTPFFHTMSPSSMPVVRLDLAHQKLLVYVQSSFW